MKPLPEKIGEKVHGGDKAILYDTSNAVDTLIDHLTDYEAEQDRRLTELDNRIQTISNNQLLIKRGELLEQRGKHLATDIARASDLAQSIMEEQPKRWRAGKKLSYFIVDTWGEIVTSQELGTSLDDYAYAIGNYHQTREQATAYKARLLELGKEI